MALKQDLETRQASLREIVSNIDKLRSRLIDESAFVGALSERDEWPTQFEGVASKYRYRPGVVGRDGTHEFRLEVKAGLTLMIKVSDANWRLFLRGMENTGKVNSVGALINGKTLRIARGDGEPIRPIAVVDDKEFYSNQDKRGNVLFKDARVTDTATLQEGVIVGRNSGGYVQVQFDDGTVNEYSGDGLRLVA